MQRLVWPLWWLFMLPNGITLVFSMLENKFNYNTPFAHRNLNVGIGYVCGLVQLLPFHRPWYFHLEHHNLAEYHADVDRHLDNAR